jgi:hypothetical protein
MKTDHKLKGRIFDNVNTSPHLPGYGRPKTRSPFPKASLRSEIEIEIEIEPENRDRKHNTNDHDNDQFPVLSWSKQHSRAGHSRARPPRQLNLDMYLRCCHKLNVTHTKPQRPAQQFTLCCSHKGNENPAPPQRFFTALPASKHEHEHEHGFCGNCNGGSRVLSEGTEKRSTLPDPSSSYQLTFYQPKTTCQSQFLQHPSPEVWQKMGGEPSKCIGLKAAPHQIVPYNMPHLGCAKRVVKTPILYIIEMLKT